MNERGELWAELTLHSVIYPITFPAGGTCVSVYISQTKQEKTQAFISLSFLPSCFPDSLAMQTSFSFPFFIILNWMD